MTAAQRILISALVLSTVAISVFAAILSFLAFRALAVQVGWSPRTDWMIWPVVELFFVAGVSEAALRTWEGRTDTGLPSALAYVALMVSSAVNVLAHVIGRLDDPWWQVTLLGIMAALVPWSQIGALHLLADRLRTLGGRVDEKVASGVRDEPAPVIYEEPEAALTTGPIEEPDTTLDERTQVDAGTGRTRTRRPTTAEQAVMEELGVGRSRAAEVVRQRRAAQNGKVRT